MTDFKMLHTMIRVRDLEKSINFYTKYLGMKVLRQSDYPDGKFTLAFIGYGDESSNTVRYPRGGGYDNCNARKLV